MRVLFTNKNYNYAKYPTYNFLKMNVSFNDKKTLNEPYIIKPITFKGYQVYILDGGNHATNMEHFAKAISGEMDIDMIDVDVNPKDRNIKQLKSLEHKLTSLNNIRNDFREIYVAVPALASVPILNIQDQYNALMTKNIKLTPENIKANKKELLLFLRKLYEHPEYYSKYINYMDTCNQGIEYTYGVIQQINALKSKGAKIFIPSGHPQDETLKWLASKRGCKEELYHFIATGEDKNGIIQKMHKEIKNNNWYNFNLLALSDANVVGVKDTKGAQDYMFAAYDSCITEGARGVYNFSPIRKEDKLVGYSYTNTYENQYPYEEFPANIEVAELAKFVGKQAYEVIASEKEIKEFVSCIESGSPVSHCADKLYPVNKVFSSSQRIAEKMELKGDFVDKSLTLFFRRNKFGEIIFPKCDCEGSSKPSVLSMWGSCFSVFNAIARDIELTKKAESYRPNAVKARSMGQYLYQHDDRVAELIQKGADAQSKGLFKQAEDYYNNAIEIDKYFCKNLSDYNRNYKPFLMLGDLHMKTGHYEYASACYNNALDILANRLLEDISFDEYCNLRRNRDKYIENKDAYSQCRFNYFTYNDLILPCTELYSKIASVCAKNNEFYPAKVCQWAVNELKVCSKISYQILERRRDKIQFIGDIYEDNRS